MANLLFRFYMPIHNNIYGILFRRVDFFIEKFCHFFINLVLSELHLFIDSCFQLIDLAIGPFSFIHSFIYLLGK